MFKKNIATMLLFCVFGSLTAWSQKNENLPVSRLIAIGATEAEILEAWGEMVLSKDLKSYSEAEVLVTQTMQVAYLQGNRNLGAALAQTAYYSTATTAVRQEITKVQLALQQNTAVTERKFKLKPEGRDLQNVGEIGKIDLPSQRQTRIQLINQAHSILATVPGMKTAKGNSPQAPRSQLFNESDVTLGSTRTLNDRTEVTAYLKQLQQNYSMLETSLKTTATQLHGIILTQQQIAQSEATLTEKMLRKAGSIISSK